MVDRMGLLVQQLADAGARRGATWTGSTEFEQTLAVLRADHGPDPDRPDPLTSIAVVFGLDDTDAALLWLAAALDLDANIGLAYGQLRGTGSAAQPSVALALELTGVPTAGAEAFTRLGSDGPLRRHRLLEVTGSEGWLSRALRVPDPVLAALAGATGADPVVARLRVDAIPMRLPGTDVLARALEEGVSLVWVRSPAGCAGLSLAAGGFAELGLNYLAVDVRRRSSDLSLRDVLASAARDAGLRGCGLVVTGAEEIAEAGDGREVSAFELFEQAAVPVVLVGSKAWNPMWLAHLPLVLEAAPLSSADRSAVWRASLGELIEDDEQLHETLLGLRLTAEAVIEATRYARVLATARGVELNADLVREAARRVGGAGAAGSDRLTVASALGSGPSFDDLILPEQATRSLHQLVSWARHRDEVATSGSLRTKGRGIAALFTGSPGTGKTLAAHVIAEELSIDLFQVDLSSIVDKYIGETEKNLEKVFQAAEALDVVLFFDEADALFGSRSDVKDSRDRYANQEVAYLLQRMEHFDGVTILATNLRGNLDKAFSRRMSFIIHFPDPDVAGRQRLWDHHLDQLPELDPADPPRRAFLAETVELAGGDIRNIVLAAAYEAVSAHQPVGHRHLAEAAVREYRKLGRVMPEHAFSPA